MRPLTGVGDLDDICAPDADTVWAVQNQGGIGGGVIIRVQLEDGKVNSDVMRPQELYRVRIRRGDLF